MFTILLCAIPLVFFSLLEAGLRISGYGDFPEQWVEVVPGKTILNPAVARRYLTAVNFTPGSIADPFDTQRRPGRFRVFALGESSAAGFPYMPLGAFSRYLRSRLAISCPDSMIEVVNIGLTGISSYALLDLLPGVLDQGPDALVVYAGHNEYYGALGVGSTSSVGRSRIMVKAHLALSRWKTYELVGDLVGMARGSTRELRGTLMAAMARDKAIPYGSDLYRAGIEQFDWNIREIASMAQRRGVPVVLGTLVCNLKDQPPFAGSQSGEVPTADDAYRAANVALGEGLTGKADSLFRLARDLDMLRFRAPEEINHRIRRLAGERGLALADVDSAFAALSPAGVAGDNLLCDHLHPTLRGYQEMGRVFFEAMRRHGLLPAKGSGQSDTSAEDSLARALMPFTRLDSAIAEVRLAVLKNDWPFRTQGVPPPVTSLVGRDTFVDSLAVEYILDRSSWEGAHRSMAAFHIRNRNPAGFIAEVEALLHQFPYVPEYLDFAGEGLVRLGDFDEASGYLTRRLDAGPSASAAKWMGIISLQRKQPAEAVRYLSQSLSWKPDDPHALFNIANACLLAGDTRAASAAIERCLALQPRYPKAREFAALLRSVRR